MNSKGNETKINWEEDMTTTRRRFLAGAGALVARAPFDPRQALFSYLVAWAFGFTTALGPLAVSRPGYITHANWVVAHPRLLQATALAVHAYPIPLLTHPV